MEGKKGLVMGGEGKHSGEFHRYIVPRANQNFQLCLFSSQGYTKLDPRLRLSGLRIGFCQQGAGTPWLTRK